MQKKSKISVDVGAALLVNDVVDPSIDAIEPSKKKLQDLTDRDLEKHERDKSLNSWEAFIFETQDKLYQDKYQAVVAEEEKEQLSGKLSKASGWMDEEGYTAGTKELKEKLSELRKVCKPISSGWMSAGSGQTAWPPSTAGSTSPPSSSKALNLSLRLTKSLLMWS